MKRTTLVLAAALAFPVALAAQTSVDQKRPAAPDASVSIENFSGSVKVTGWPKAEVAVKGTARRRRGAGPGRDRQGRSPSRSRCDGQPDGREAATSRCSSRRRAASASRASRPRSRSRASPGRCRPRRSTARSRTTAPSKDVQLQSVNGAVETTQPTGRVQVEAVNGPVTVRDASGDARGLHGEREAHDRRRLLRPCTPRVGRGRRALRRHAHAQGDARRRNRERGGRALLPRRLRRRLHGLDLQRSRSRTSWAPRPRRRASGLRARSCASRAARAGRTSASRRCRAPSRSARSSPRHH